MLIFLIHKQGTLNFNVIYLYHTYIYSVKVYAYRHYTKFHKFNLKDPKYLRS